MAYSRIEFVVDARPGTNVGHIGPNSYSFNGGFQQTMDNMEFFERDSEVAKVHGQVVHFKALNYNLPSTFLNLTV